MSMRRCSISRVFRFSFLRNANSFWKAEEFSISVRVARFPSSSFSSAAKLACRWIDRLSPSVWDSDLIGAELERMIVQRDVNAEMGWLLRKDFKKSTARFELKPRPESKTIRQLFFRANANYFTNQAGQAESHDQNFTFESLF